MAYTLEQFCQDCHDALTADPGPGGREQVRAHLEKLLANKNFVAEHLSSQSKGKTLLHHDPETGFYVMAHGTDSGKTGKPHDHGASWAVYGQGIGLTNMTEWRRTDDGGSPEHAEIEVERKFPLEPGKAALFDSWVIHSTAHPGPARWVRVTGTDLDTIERYSYDPERKTAKMMNAA